MDHETEGLERRVTDWLLQRRAETFSRAVEHGLPPAVAILVPVAEFTDNGGMQSTNEQRQVSLFAASPWLNVHPNLYASATKPLIDGTGEDLAEALVDAFSERIVYASNVGPAIVKQDMEHPHLVTDLPVPEASPTDIGKAMLGWDPIFYALMLLRNSLLEYLSEVPTLAQDDNVLAARLARELVGFAASDEVTHLGRIPLAGVDLDDQELAVDDCRIVRLSRDELGHLFWRRHNTMYQPSRVAASLPGTMSPETWLQERVALEVRQRHPKKDLFFTMASHSQKVLLGLHLVGISFAGAGFGAMLREPRWAWGTGQSFQPLLMPRQPPQSPSRLDLAQFREALSIARLIPEGAVNGPSSPMELCIQRVGLAMSRVDAREALVDYTVALEALFLGGDDTGEARRRFSLNGAVYAASKPGDSRRVYGVLSEIYNARSAMVHGVNPATKRSKRAIENAPLLRDSACEIARISVRKALMSSWPKEDVFLNLLLDDRFKVQPDK
jgi:hypothetical protein